MILGEDLEEIGIPRLTSKQIEKLCEVGEQAAREHVLSKISASKISVLNITIDTQGPKPLNVDVDVEIVLPSRMKGLEIERLAKEASDRAFDSIKEYIRELTCKSTR